MFIYEKGNSLNLTLESNIPVENPEVVITGYEDGATLTVNGSVFGNGSKEFSGKAKTFVYQKSGKLFITFHGIAGMSNPEVTIDDLGDNNYEVVVDGKSVTLTIAEGKVEFSTEENVEEPQVEVPSKPKVIEEEVPEE